MSFHFFRRPAPEHRYVVRQLCRGRYLNSPRVWRTRCEITAPDRQSAIAWLFAHEPLLVPDEESLALIPWAPSVPGEFQDPDCRPNMRRNR